MFLISMLWFGQRSSCIRYLILKFSIFFLINFLFKLNSLAEMTFFKQKTKNWNIRKHHCIKLTTSCENLSIKIRSSKLELYSTEINKWKRLFADRVSVNKKKICFWNVNFYTRKSHPHPTSRVTTLGFVLRYKSE